MHFWKVESIATDENTCWDAGSQVPGGVMGDNFQLFTDFERAFKESRRIDESADSFVKEGYARGFYGSVTRVYLPIETMQAMLEGNGVDEFVAAYKFVMED